jgi:hypothetical protein
VPGLRVLAHHACKLRLGDRRAQGHIGFNR